MDFQKLDNAVEDTFTALLYCPPGVGKSTAIGLISERLDGNTLVLDVDRTITKTLNKHEIVQNTDKVYVTKIDNINTCEDWDRIISDLVEMKKSGKLDEMNIKCVAVDNISELERCFLSDMGSKGKNRGVPAMGDYQVMQFKLVNSLRKMKSLGINVVWTAWEDARQITMPDGTAYTQIIPKVSAKVVDNICGLCDVVGKIFVNKDGEHGILLEATQNIYAKNQIDSRKACKVEDFVKFKREDK